jgi:type I restriction enzyme S subunit
MKNRTVSLGNLVIENKEIVFPDSKEAFDRPYLGLEQIESNTGEILSKLAVNIDGKSNTYAFDERHVLYGKLRPYLNKVALPDYRGRCSTEIIPFLPNGIDREYLALLFRTETVVNAAMADKTGSRMPRADIEKLLSQKVKIPENIDDQRRISARIKAQLSEVEKSRKAVGIQLYEAKALLKAYLQEAFEGEEAKKWPVVPLGDSGEVVSGITLGRKETNKELRDVPYLRVANVKDGYLDLSEIKTVAATESEISKWRLQSGDILLTEGGDPDKLGRGTFWSDELVECIHQNHIFRVRFSSDKYLPDFLASQFGSSYGKDYFLAHAKKTTGIATINQKVLKNFPLLSPTIEEQRKLMDKLSERVQQTKNVVSVLLKMEREIDILASCLLSKAFE